MKAGSDLVARFFGGTKVAFLRTIAFAVFCSGGIIAVSLWPPERGELIVYYPFTTSEKDALHAVYGTDARLVAPGPIASSWVIWLDHAETAAQLTSQGGILMDPLGFQGCRGRQQSKENLQDQGYLREF